MIFRISIQFINSKFSWILDINSGSKEKEFLIFEKVPIHEEQRGWQNGRWFGSGA
jgi:hypothetical protein